MHAVNPYFGNSFTEFFVTLFQRFSLLLQGELGLRDLATDEIQVLVLAILGCCSALVGTFLVLRRMTMLANSLSHTILLGIVITAILVRQSNGHLLSMNLTSLIIASLVTGLLTTLSTEFFQRKMRLQEDASIGLVFSVFFALGIIALTLFSRSSHLGIEAIMGNVDALHLRDLKLVFYLFLFNAAVTLLFFKRYALVAFDPVLARNMGISLFIINQILMIQAAATAIGAFRAVGVFLFLALLVAPVLTARFFTNCLKKLLITASLIGIMASLLTVALSRHLLSVYQMPLSTAGLMTLVLGGLFLFGILISRMVRYGFRKRITLYDKADRHIGEHGLHRPEHP